jgi:hypothetical protein
VLAKRINGSLEWLKQTERPHVVVAEDGPDFEKHFSFPDVVALFLTHASLYSWPYLSLMISQLNNSGRLRIGTLTLFLTMLCNPRILFMPAMLPKLLNQFISTCKITLPEVERIVEEITNKVVSPQMSQLLHYVNISAEMRDIECVVKLV